MASNERSPREEAAQSTSASQVTPITREQLIAAVLTRAKGPLALQVADAVMSAEVPDTATGLLIVDGRLRKVLDWQPGEFLDGDREYILCAVHGASYETQTGRCAGGPCGRGKLTALRVEERGGEVYWYPSRDIQPVP